jgi:hypothetical protein
MKVFFVRALSLQFLCFRALYAEFSRIATRILGIGFWAYFALRVVCTNLPPLHLTFGTPKF